MLKRWVDSLGGPVRLLNEDGTVHEEAIKSGGESLFEAIYLSGIIRLMESE